MADKALIAAYLVVGEDAHKRQHVFERMEKRIGALGDLDFNEDVFLGATADAGVLVTALSTPPFLCDYRLVVVKDAEKLPAPVVDALVAYLAAPCPTTVLYLDAAKLAKNTRLYKACAKLGKNAIVDCAPKKARDLPATVRDFAASKGALITPQAADELIGLVGEDTVHLDAELTKLVAALGKGATIDVADVRKHVVASAEPKPWLLSDALAARDATRCLQLLGRMPSQSPYGLLPRCVQLLRELLVAQELSGQPAGALAAELGKPAWMVKNHQRWARGFSARELEGALVAAAECEARMKSGADAQRSFECWLLQTCTRQAG